MQDAAWLEAAWQEASKAAGPKQRQLHCHCPSDARPRRCCQQPGHPAPAHHTRQQHQHQHPVLRGRPLHRGPPAAAAGHLGEQTQSRCRVQGPVPLQALTQAPRQQVPAAPAPVPAPAAARSTRRRQRQYRRRSRRRHCYCCLWCRCCRLPAAHARRTRQLLCPPILMSPVLLLMALLLLQPVQEMPAAACASRLPLSIHLAGPQHWAPPLGPAPAPALQGSLPLLWC